MPEAIRILITGGSRIFREGLRMLLETQHDFAVIGAAGGGGEALQLMHDSRPDIQLLDLETPSPAALKLLDLVGNGNSGVRTLLLVSAIERNDVIKALELGVRGVMLKESPPDLLFKSTRSVMAGQYWVGRDMLSDLVTSLVRRPKSSPAASAAFGLTRRELEVLTLLVAGSTNRDLAERLGITEDTVKHHLTSIFNRTGSSNRLELALFAIHHDLVQPE